MQAYAIMDMLSFSIITNKCSGRLCIFETESLAGFFLANNIEDPECYSVHPVAVEYILKGGSSEAL